jgi:hypothetical protein
MELDLWKAQNLHGMQRTTGATAFKINSTNSQKSDNSGFLMYDTVTGLSQMNESSEQCCTNVRSLTPVSALYNTKVTRCTDTGPSSCFKSRRKISIFYITKLYKLLLPTYSNAMWEMSGTQWSCFSDIVEVEIPQFPSAVPWLWVHV